MAVRIMIIYSETSSKIDILHHYPFLFKNIDNCFGAPTFICKHIFHIRNLGPYMEMQSLES